MGKKQITQLLEQLKENQALELQNAAAIYTVAQVAVNELKKQESDEPTAVASLPFVTKKIDKYQLIEQHGSYNVCRKVAKSQGIKFSRTPSWEQLAAAFSYAEAFQEIVKAYVEAHPSSILKGTTFELRLNK